MTNERVVPEVSRLLEGFGSRLAWVHITNSVLVNGSPGFPDFLIAGRGGLLFAECKPSAGRRPRPDQLTWKYMLLAAGARWELWTQTDLDNGTIERELNALAG